MIAFRNQGEASPMKTVQLFYAASFVLFGLQINTYAQADSEIVSADTITQTLSRKIGFKKKDSDSYSTPDTSPHVSLSSITFELNQADLTSIARRQLDEVAVSLGKLLTEEDAKVLVEGHTCDRGESGHNQTLSEERARSVYAYLTKNGVPADRLSTSGRGESRPVRPNEGEANRQLNRRVDFVFRVPTQSTRNVKNRLFESFITEVVADGTGNPLSNRVATTLNVGEYIRVDIVVQESGFVYAVYIGANGDVTWLSHDQELFADSAAFSEPLWKYSGEEIHFPDDLDNGFPMEDPSARECIAIVATQDNEPSLDELVEALNALLGAGGGNSTDDTKNLRTALSSETLHAEVLLFKVR
jgi:outer membrane protein OmpA-like peptidoglycan-associated protein